MSKRKLNKNSRFLVLVVFFLCIVDTSFALVISEIHPKPPSPQSGKEWIEIFNDHTNSLKLTEYSLFENDGNRNITSINGEILESGEYAVIVQNESEFRKIFPTYSGKIFRASFSSLTDGGEVLSLRHMGKADRTVFTIDYKMYSNSLEYGQSLTYDGKDYIKSSSTPGTGTLQIGSQAAPVFQDNVTDSGVETATTSAVESYQSPVYYFRSYWPESEKIYVDAGENKIVLAGADVVFSAKSVTGDKRQVSNANFFWSFGDGETSEGKEVLHSYKWSGEYVVNVEGYANGYKNDDRFYVKVIDPELSISLGKQKDEIVVEIKNLNKEEINVGGFLVKSSGGEFEYTSTLSKNLVILPNKSVKLSQNILKFATSTDKVVLCLPSGNILTEYQGQKTVKHDLTKNTGTTTVVSANSNNFFVYTKEEFEKNMQQEQYSQIQSKQLKKVVAKKVIPQNVVEPILEVTHVENKFKNETATKSESDVFIIQNSNTGLLSTLLNYFGF